MSVRKSSLIGSLALVSAGCAGAGPHTAAPASQAAPEAVTAAASETVFSCVCAIGPREEPPGEAAACRLVWRSDGTAALSGATRRGGVAPDAAGVDVAVAGSWDVVPVPPERVEPEPFVAFRGALSVDGVARPDGVEVWFIDNLMYVATLDASGASLHLTCSPPEE
jgi:hypothetical protein